MLGLTLDQLHVGDEAEWSRTVTETDIALFAAATGDMNPFHMDEEFAKTTVFGGRIAHGMMLAGMISRVLGMQLPGHGTIYASQSLSFRAPVRIGDTVTARVQVAEVLRDQRRVRLSTTCRNQEGTILVEGEAMVSPPKPKQT